MSQLILSPEVNEQQSIQYFKYLHNVTMKATNMNSFTVQVGIRNDHQWKKASLTVLSLKVTKKLLQGPIVIHFSSLYDAISGRCFLSKFSIYGFPSLSRYIVVNSIMCSVVYCRQAKSTSEGITKNGKSPPCTVSLKWQKLPSTSSSSSLWLVSAEYCFCSFPNMFFYIHWKWLLPPLLHHCP